MSDCELLIAEYLSHGGVFNPELMDHAKVRDLIIQCQAEIQKLKQDREKLVVALNKYALPKTWMREPDQDVARMIESEDCESVPGYARYCGGKRARQTLKEIGE